MSPMVLFIVVLLMYFNTPCTPLETVTSKGDFYVVGFFSFAEESSVLSSLQWVYTMKHAIRNYNENHSVKVGFIFHKVNVSDNTTLMKIDESISLLSTAHTNISKVLCVISIVYPSLSIYIANLTKIFQIPYFNYNPQTVEKNFSIHLHDWTIEVISLDAIFTQLFEEVASHYELTGYYIIFSRNYQKMAEDLWNLSLNKKRCVYFESINSFSFDDLIYKLKFSAKGLVIVLYADEDDADVFIRKSTALNLYNQTLIGNIGWTNSHVMRKIRLNISQKTMWLKTHHIFSPALIDSFYSYSHGDSIKNNDTWIENFFQTYFANKNSSLKDFNHLFRNSEFYNAMLTIQAQLEGLMHYEKLLDKISLDNFTLVRKYNMKNFFSAQNFTMSLLTFDRNVSEQTDLMNGPINNRSWTKLDDNLRKSLRLECKVKCSTGLGPKYQIHSKSNKAYMQWECEQCTEDFHDTCNHFRKDIFPLDQPKSFIAFALIGIGVLSSLVVLIIFQKFRNTPFVRSSNIHMSISQLLAHALLFIADLMFIGEPNVFVCTCRSFVFGILLTFIMAVTLMKTQKLSFLFQAQIRVSKKEIYMSKTMEVTLILIMVAIQALVAATSAALSKQKLEKSYDGTTSRHVIACNTGQEFFIQLLFSFLLMVMCLTQAFRARNLPENFNETKFIAAAMFISAVLVAMFLPLRIQATTNEAITTSDLFMMISINYTLLFIMYSYKCWIIVFRPERNTTSAFAKKIRDHVLEGVDQSIRCSVSLGTPRVSIVSNSTTRTSTMQLSMYTET